MGVSLTLLVIRVENLDRSRAFYEKMGIQFAKEKHGSGPEHYTAEIGDVVFELYPVSREAQSAAIRLGFCVPSLDTALADLTEIGAEIVKPAGSSTWGRRAVVKDPDGYTIELSEKLS